MKLSKNKLDRNNEFSISIIYERGKNKTYFYIFMIENAGELPEEQKRRPGVVRTPGKKYEKEKDC